MNVTHIFKGVPKLDAAGEVVFLEFNDQRAFDGGQVDIHLGINRVQASELVYLLTGWLEEQRAVEASHA